MQRARFQSGLTRMAYHKRNQNPYSGASHSGHDGGPLGMKNELDYIRIGAALGGNQEWFTDWSMYDGGCAAVTACDVCMYLTLRKGIEGLYPYRTDRFTRQDYIRFSQIMKPYLHPCWQGIDTLEQYISGFSKYCQDIGGYILNMEGFSGRFSVEGAKGVIQQQIDKGLPIPYLLLYHKNPSFKDFEWHWFNLAGYGEYGGGFYVRAVTYGLEYWLNLEELWDTGRSRKGGMVLLSV